MQGAEPGIVMEGTYVRIALVNVPQEAAEAVCGRTSSYLLGKAPPLTALALHKHECKLSIVNMVVRKHAGYEDPVANKEQLTFVTGLRTFAARPILSTNEYNTDKFKLEKFMHPGRTYVMSVFAPIAYPPLPVLVIKQVSSFLLPLSMAARMCGFASFRMLMQWSHALQVNRIVAVSVYCILLLHSRALQAGSRSQLLAFDIFATGSFSCCVFQCSDSPM